MKKQQNITKPNQLMTILITALSTLAVVTIVLVLVFTIKSENSQFNGSYSTPNGQIQQVETEPGTFSEITSENVSTNNYISTQDALDAALKAFGADRNAVRDIDVELEYRGGQTFYEVSFEQGQYDYEYYVDATSGNILKSFKEIDR